MSRHVVLALATVLCLGAAAKAATTPVAITGSWDGANRTLDYVLGAAYGYTDGIGNAVLFDSGTGVDGTMTWSNGGNSITFTRVADSGGSGNLLLSGANYSTGQDSIWSDGTPTFNVDVRYAAQGQILGWTNNVVVGGGDILEVTGSGLNPSFTYFAGNPPAALSSDFTWYDKTGPFNWSSDSAQNTSDGDHMVTYWISGTFANGNLINGGLGAYVLCFEDLPLNSSDRDYNDLVVQVSTVPLPAAVLPGLAMLAGLGLFGAWRRRSRA